MGASQLPALGTGILVALNRTSAGRAQRLWKGPAEGRAGGVTWGPICWPVRGVLACVLRDPQPTLLTTHHNCVTSLFLAACAFHEPRDGTHVIVLIPCP